jgi:hypothetical protein
MFGPIEDIEGHASHKRWIQRPSGLESFKTFEKWKNSPKDFKRITPKWSKKLMTRFFENYESMTQRWVEEEHLRAIGKTIENREEVFGAAFNMEVASKDQEKESLRKFLQQTRLYLAQEFLDPIFLESLRSFLVIADPTLQDCGGKITWGLAKEHLQKQAFVQDEVFPLLASLCCLRRRSSIKVHDWLMSIKMFQTELKTHSVVIPDTTWTSMAWNQFNKEEKMLLKRGTLEGMKRQLDKVHSHEIPEFHASQVRAAISHLPQFPSASGKSSGSLNGRAAGGDSEKVCALHGKGHSTEECRTKCKRCGKPGHKAAQCKSAVKEETSSATKRSVKETSFHMEEPKEPKEIVRLVQDRDGYWKWKTKNIDPEFLKNNCQKD